MGDQNVVLRVKFKSGNYNLNDLKTNSTADQLKAAIAQISGLTKVGFRVLIGFPPRVKDLSYPNYTLKELGIKSGDTLIIETLGMSDNLKKNFNDPNMRIQSCNENGSLMKKMVPADNSCLFTSVYYIISEGIIDPTCAKVMRQIIADSVKANKETYTEAFLGKKNSDYRRWILKDDSWGGAIELSILSSHFGLEIVTVDAQTGQLSCFGEDRHYACRGFVFYDGIHYDPLAYEVQLRNESGESNNESEIQVIFSSNDQFVYQSALELGIEAKKSKQYTNVQQFLLRCGNCNEKFTGQDSAVQHAKETGHTNFSEVS